MADSEESDQGHTRDTSTWQAYIMSNTFKRAARHEGLVVDYSEDVTEQHVQRIDSLVREEFECGDWVTVEQES